MNLANVVGILFFVPIVVIIINLLCEHQWYKNDKRMSDIQTSILKRKEQERNAKNFRDSIK